MSLCRNTPHPGHFSFGGEEDFFLDDELFFDGDVEDEVARQGERRPPKLLRGSDRDEKEDLAEMQECFVGRLVVVASAKQEVPPFLKPPWKPRAKGKEVLL